MSLTNVLLIHVSSRYMPRTDAEEEKERQKEYYTLLGLPIYAPIAEIRKAYRRNTLQIRCDRMMLEWSNNNEGQAAKTALDEKESLVKEAFQILGDKHLRQQYHLLQCRPSRYGMMKGPLAVIHALTQSRRWFPLLVLQSVILASMINAVDAQYQTQEWIYVLIPTWCYYGLIVLFWLGMLELPWRRYCTWRSFGAMLAACSQHVCMFNGCFWMARYWDRATGPNINWYILSIPFYLAILFRCCCTMAAVASLRELQSKMISRENLNSQQQLTTDEPDKSHTIVPEGYIAVTKDSSMFSGLLLKLSDDEIQDPKMLEVVRVESSPEYRQVDRAASTLYQSAIQLASLGSAFITLMALKLEDAFDVSFWIIFIPIWIYFLIRLYATSKPPNRVPPRSTAAITNHPQPQPNTSRALNSPSIDTGTRVTATEDSGEGESDVQPVPPALPMDVKSLSTGGYTAVDVIIDVPTQSMSHDDNGSLVEKEKDSTTPAPKPSLVDSVQLALTTEENDVEAALPLIATINDAPSSDPPTTPAADPITVETNLNPLSAPSEDQEIEPAVSEEFERWQSVYENQEVRTSHFHFIPCEVLFHLMIVCLIVAKLDESYENTSPEVSNFNAFYILLVPFSVGLVICCCALAVGILALNTEASAPPSGPAATPEDLEAQGVDASEGNGNSDELAPMQAGAKAPREKSFATHLDVHMPDLSFPQRIQILTAALPISSTDAETCLIESDVGGLRSTKTVWEQVVICADNLKCETASKDENIPEIESFDKACVLLLREYLEAHFDKLKFQTALNSIESLDEDNDDEVAAGIECPVCCEAFRIEDTVHCEGNPIHLFCRVCFHRYATETVQAGDVAGMPCADANCQATFSTPTVKANLSKWELLRQRDREQERNQKVALAAKSVLNCTCGAVGIVTEEDVGDGCIQCPGDGCDKQFCALCGNNWHPETSCPPTKKMLQWVVQNTMPCPNCHTPIEKNYGCDHMHCAPPGGCGHHFSYKTGKPMSKHGRNLRGLY